ncbi:MAG: DNA/RNA non-specific endonuclease [Pseudomonadota bacterium]|nr:DNA/RNA non-specific endonuclease [Pseudomonadota bacterium]
MSISGRVLLGSCSLFLSSTLVLAAERCPENYWQGQAPVILNQNMKAKTRPLCFNGFTVMHSGVTRTPLWAAHHLTAVEIQSAREIDRQDSFRAETRLPTSERAELSDYRGSGYDRGHLVPNGDMADREQQYDSFSLANMMPQSPNNNRVIWNNLEQALRGLVLQEQEAYVVTGGAFLGQRLQKIGQNGVFVPTDTFKAVYFPKRKAGSAYWAPNDESGRVEVITLAELDRRLGIQVFPALTDAVRQQKVALPLSTAGQPRVPRSSSSNDTPTDNNPSPNWLQLLLSLLQSLIQLFTGK